VGGPSEFHLPVALVSTVVALAGLLFSYVIYRKAKPGTDPLPQALGPVWTLWNRLYYIDDFYLFLVKRVQDGLAWLSWKFERSVIIGTLVNGTAYVVRWSSDKVRRVQNGSVSAYATAFALAAVILASIVLLASCAG
jgi:NADH-quinone oxidoreductase subunit L